MENIIAVMVEKFRKSSGKRSVELVFKVLDEELDGWHKKNFKSKQEKDEWVLLNILSSAYQEGISAGKKLAARDGMNEIDAVTFAIKQLQKAKDELKSSIAKELVKK